MLQSTLSIWAVAALIAVSIGTCTYAIASWFLQGRARPRDRDVQQQLETLSRTDFGAANESLGLLRRSHRGAGFLQALWKRFPHASNIELLLEQAALSWSVQTFGLLSIGGGIALAGGVSLITGNLVASVGAGALGLWLPYGHAQRCRQRRFDRFEEAFPEALDLMGRALRAGYPISTGLQMVANEAEEPIAGEFQRVFEQQRFGLAFEDALLNLVDRVPLTDVRILVTGILIQREVGGNLAEVLDKLSSVVRQRFSIYRDLKSKTAQGRLSGIVLFCLPIGVGVMMTLIAPERMALFVEAEIGRLMLGAAAFAQVIGFFWIRRVTRIEV